MKQWVKGDHAAASRLDPTIGAIVAAIVDVAVRLDLHTRLGIGEAEMLQIAVEVAFLAFLIRSVQTNLLKKKLAAPAPTPAPADDPPPSEPSEDAED